MPRVWPAFYDFTMGLSRRILEPRREQLVSSAAGNVLEVGIGTGLNLAFYPTAVQLIGVDPDLGMLARATERAAGWPFRPVRLVVATAEALPFLDASFDEVVASLVFCSVASPARSLVEVRRVLRVGGVLRFMEHVRSESRSWARVQDVVTPAWIACCGGCHPNRPTAETIEQAGFVIETIQHFALGPYPTRPQILGTARRGP